MGMENSEAYIRFINLLNANGPVKKDGYDPQTMEKIFDWERDEVEDLVWEYFYNQGDNELCDLLPKLRKYDGMNALKERVSRLKIPSYASVVVSKVLYDCTGEESYLEIVKRNIDAEPNNIAYVSNLAFCKTSEKQYEMLKDIYINNEDNINRGIAVRGMLYVRGIMQSVDGIDDVLRTKEFREKFKSDSKKERKVIIKRFEEGKL